jgi:hypothetical protein
MANMTFRKLRIAFSVTCGIVAVLLCGLWVRSYWIADRVNAPLRGKQSFAISSMFGGLTLVTYESRPDPNEWKSGYYLCGVDDREAFPGRIPTTLGFSRIPQPFHWVTEVTIPMPGKPPGWNTVYNAGVTQLSGTALTVPFWCLVATTCAITLAPWLRRYSLRTLLIATTLVCVVLGLVVWLL